MKKITLIPIIFLLLSTSTLLAQEKKWQYSGDVRVSVAGTAAFVQPSLLTTHGFTFKENFFLGVGTGYYHSPVYSSDAHLIPVYGTIRGYIPFKNWAHRMVLNLDLGAAFFIPDTNPQCIFYGNIGIGVDWKIRDTKYTISTMIVGQTPVGMVPLPIPGVSVSFNF
jgi:hypothetical protein